MKLNFKNLLFQNIAIVAFGNMAAKAIGIITTPIITRLYTPADYGIFSIFLSVISIIGSISTLRYSITIPLAKTERIADSLLHLCFIIASLWAISLFILAFTVGNQVSSFFNTQELIPYLYFIPLAILIKGVYEGLNNWSIRNKYFKLITMTKLSQSSASAGVKIGLGWLNFTPVGLIWGQITQEFAGTVSLALRLKKIRPKFFTSFSLSKIKYVARRFKNFPLFQSWSQLLLSLGSQLPILLLGALYGTKEVGVFGLANTMINLPLNLVGQSVAQVYYAEIANIGKDRPKRIYELSISIIKKMFWIGFTIAVLIALLGPWIFSLVFGKEWYDAGIYARVLSVLIVTRFVSNPIANLFNLFEKQDIQLWINIGRLLLVLIIFYIANLLEMNPIRTITTYSVGMAFFYGFSIYVILRTVRNQISKVD